MYWDIGRKLCIEVLGGEKASYGRTVVGEISAKLALEYGKGFEKLSVFKMIKFYQEFSDYQKVATLSQQLTWSHFVELLPIEDELKRDFYAAMCKNETGMNDHDQQKKNWLPWYGIWQNGMSANWNCHLM